MTRRSRTSRTLAVGGAVAVAVALLALGGPLVAVERSWPLLLGAAVGFAPGGTVATRGLGLVGGLVVGWGSAIVGAGLLPATPVGDALAAGLAVLAVTLLAAAARGKVPLWTWLAGLGALAAARPDAAVGVAAPRFADVADAALGLATGLLLAGVGAVLSARADAAQPPSVADRADGAQPPDGDDRADAAQPPDGDARADAAQPSGAEGGNEGVGP